jgi:hypothetical protein
MSSKGTKRFGWHGRVKGISIKKWRLNNFDNDEVVKNNGFQRGPLELILSKK